MKYIIVPILRFFGLILIYSFIYPVVFIIFSLIALWEFDTSVFGELKGDFIEAEPGYDYAYKTAWDWFINKKTFVNKTE